jgi:hypothetical protein
MPRDPILYVMVSGGFIEASAKDVMASVLSMNGIDPEYGKEFRLQVDAKLRALRRAEEAEERIAAVLAVLDRVDGDPDYSPGWAYLSDELRPLLVPQAKEDGD